MGLVEVERLSQKYDLDVRFAPFLLDPSIPPEGKERRQHSKPGDPPSQLETRGESLGITFRRGRTWSSNSHLALEASEWAEGRPQVDAFHRRLFKAYFDDLAEIGGIDLLVGLADEVGLPGEELREALETGALREQVDDGINWSRQIGVTAVPTFIIDERTGLVGAQPLEVFEQVLRELGKVPRGS